MTALTHLRPSERKLLDALGAHSSTARVSRAELQAVTGLSESSVKRGLRALAAAGLLERLKGGHGRGDTSVYRLQKGVQEGGHGDGKGVTDELAQRRGSKGSDTGKTVSQGRGSKGGQERGSEQPPLAHAALDLELQEPELPTTPLGPPADPIGDLLGEHQQQLPVTQTITAQTILGAFIDEAKAADVVVPRRTIGMLAKPIKELLDEGISPARVAAGLALMVQRRKVIPSMLANLTMEAQLPSVPVASPTAMRYGRGMTTRQILDQARPA